MSILLPALNDPYHIDVIERLIAKGVDIQTIITHSIPDLIQRKTFKDITLIDEHSFQYIDQIKQLMLPKDIALQEDILSSFNDIESLFLSISDRLCFYPKTVRERKHIFNKLLLYWLSYLENSKPTAILFLYIPHLGYDNVIYAVAKYLKIPTLLLKDTIYHKILLIESFGDPAEKVPHTYLQNKSLSFIKKNIGSELLEMFYKNNKLITFNKQLNDLTIKQQKIGLFRSLFNAESLQSLVILLRHPFQRVEGSMFYLEKPIYWLQNIWFLILYYLKSKQLFLYYQSLTSFPRYSEHFCYFPLHYQPERTTMPEAGIFEDQLLALDILSKSAPKGWKIYVKEHPSQLCRSDLRKMNFRDKTFYSTIASYDNVRIMPITYSSEELIKKSVCTVTMTGSAGWEALLLGKPVILFSNSAWYAACNSCFIVDSIQSCKTALTQIVHSSPKKVKLNVFKYLSYYKRKFIPGAFASEFIKDSPMPYELMVSSLSKTIYQKLQSLTRN